MPGAYCSIPGCTTSRRSKGVAIFRIPTKDDEYSVNWRNKLVRIITEIREMNESLQRQIDRRTLHICELHYSLEKKLYHDKRTTLIPGSLPTLIIPAAIDPRHTRRSMNSPKRRRGLLKRKATEDENEEDIKRIREEEKKTKEEEKGGSDIELTEAVPKKKIEISRDLRKKETRKPVSSENVDEEDKLNKESDEKQKEAQNDEAVTVLIENLSKENGKEKPEETEDNFEKDEEDGKSNLEKETEATKSNETKSNDEEEAKTNEGDTSNSQIEYTDGKMVSANEKCNSEVENNITFQENSAILKQTNELVNDNTEKEEEVENVEEKENKPEEHSEVEEEENEKTSNEKEIELTDGGEFLGIENLEDNEEGVEKKVKREKREVKLVEGRERRKTKSKYSNMDSDDLEKMLVWKKGIGSLPGTNLKFVKSANGSLDVTQSSDDENTEDDDENEDVNENGSENARRGPWKKRRSRGGRRTLRSPEFTFDDTISSPTSKTKDDELLSPDITGAKGKRNRKKKRERVAGDNKICKCETCGIEGDIAEFRSSGRFCSQRCVGAYASKRRAEMIAEQFAMGARPIPKSGRKKKREIKDESICSSQNATNDEDSNSASQANLSLISDDSNTYYQSGTASKEFDWDEYLKVTNTKAVPEEVFLKEFKDQDLFYSFGAEFKQSMKMECIDPRHQSCFCVVSVVEAQGARLRLHFDGWSENYDFWINADSSFLYPCGWCEKNGQKLCPPRRMKGKPFSWTKYLEETGCESVPDFVFRDRSQKTHGFTTEMKLEAVDRKNPDLICVASVNNTVGDHFLIHFDEWDDSYDYWCKDDSPFIHPVGWCTKNNVPLIPPTDDMINKFLWEDYLSETNTIAAPADIFIPRNEPFFEVGQKLEAIDPRNPSLVRVSTIVELEEFRLKVHFDGWSSIYDYWFDTDSVDLHPVKWAHRTGHPLEPPPSNEPEESVCGTRGCRGVGHFKGAKFTSHHTSFGCPYTLHNLNRTTTPVIDRLSDNALGEEQSIANRIYKKKIESFKEEVFPDSTTKGDPEKPIRYSGRAVGRPPKHQNYIPTQTMRAKTKGKRGGYRERKKLRRSSDEIISSTTATAHSGRSNSLNGEHSNSYLTKPIPTTHRPASQSHIMYRHDSFTPSKAIPWSSEEVTEFLVGIGYEDLVPRFKEHQIDGQALLLLSQADLVHHLKIKLGPALKIYNEISKL